MFASNWLKKSASRSETAAARIVRVGQSGFLAKSLMLSALIGSLFVATQAVTAKAVEPTLTIQNSALAQSANETADDSRLSVDGVYLYGQSAQPDQPGSAYMVFEARSGMTIGAFYMPNSSFDCFYGPLQTDQAALTVVDSYSQETFDYSLALQQEEAIAGADGAAPMQFSIEGFQQLDELSDLDREILATCQADHQAQVWQ
ncbi:MAG: hypothetical protein F6K04_24840 [Leptolyngbya sp. SIO4C5]|nr:hypothetical protein [Leptolyngbya sp. SIO4C5]